MLQESKGLETQEVHLYQATLFNLKHSVLACKTSALLVRDTERNIFVQRFPSNDYTCSMEGCMPAESFKPYGSVKELFIYSPSVPYILKFLLKLQGIG